MKKLFAVLAITAGLSASAQEKQQPKAASPVTFGVKAGFNGSTFSRGERSDVDNSEKIKAGSHIGIFANIPVAEKFCIQPELLFSQLGSKTEDLFIHDSGDYFTKQEYEYKTNLNYLTLPIMVQYNILPQLYVEAGPEFGLLLGGKIEGDGRNEIRYDNTTTVNSESFSDKISMKLYNKFNFGIGIGAGYYFTQNFGVTARFTAGITGIFKNDYGSKVRNNALQLGVAYRFK
ncbi:porin family protein [Chryseobacterium sp. KLBC 52]|uniref:porin family protein n=1 Tax=Chryseobacterium sp. KLBC 52 TaxID=1862702 RepID=UPI000E09E983|nr:porin family protein [Chryseobacterium sp. KLBC 52]